MPSNSHLSIHNGSVYPMAFLNLFIFILLKADARAPNFRGIDSEDHKKLSNNSSIKVIQAANGDVFDCVEIYKQPAFDHPLLRDHKLQMRPSSYPKGLTEKNLNQSRHVSFELENGGCPEGSVPIIRVHEGDLNIRRNPLPCFEAQQPTQGPNAITMWATQRTYNKPYYGAVADLNVYAIPQVGRDQISVSAIWITEYNNSAKRKLAAIEVGWQVHPELYKDDKTRLFIYWTADSHQSTGCYDLRCPGFVVTSRAARVGGAIYPLSTYGGAQYIIRPLVYKDKVSGNWWFALNDHTNVLGYWPKEIFYDFDFAGQVTYGGLTTFGPNERRPPMGNGHFPEEPNSLACFVSHVKTVDDGGTMRDLSRRDRFAYASDPICYSVGPYDGHLYFFRFGGDGHC